MLHNSFGSNIIQIRFSFLTGHAWFTNNVFSMSIDLKLRNELIDWCVYADSQ